MGRWYAIGTNIREQDGRLVARVAGDWHGMYRTYEELGRITAMIRSAPELLAALQQIIASVEDQQIPPFAGLDKAKDLVREINNAAHR